MATRDSGHWLDGSDLSFLSWSFKIKLTASLHESWGDQRGVTWKPPCAFTFSELHKFSVIDELSKLPGYSQMISKFPTRFMRYCQFSNVAKGFHCFRRTVKKLAVKHLKGKSYVLPMKFCYKWYFRVDDVLLLIIVDGVEDLDAKICFRFICYLHYSVPLVKAIRLQIAYCASYSITARRVTSSLPSVFLPIFVYCPQVPPCHLRCDIHPIEKLLKWFTKTKPQNFAAL